MTSFNLTLSGKHFICPSILNYSFAGQNVLGCRSLPFMTSNTSFQALLACKIFFEKSADSLMGTPLQVTLLSPCFFQDFLFIFNLGQFNDDVPGCVPPWVQLLWDSLGFLESWKSISFTRLGMLSFIIVQITFQFLAVVLFLLAPL